MGFPGWTLWGMGISAFAALISLALSLVGQSPQFLRRSGLIGARLDLRVRTFTTFAFAFLLLAFGFFVAGVPLGDQPANTVTELAGDQESVTLDDAISAGEATSDNAGTILQATASSTRATPATGSFDGPPVSTPGTSQALPEEPGTISNPPEQGDSESQETSTASPTTTATATTTLTATPGATSTAPLPPTTTPTPSLTPTPISGETTQIETQGSTLWIKRSPGGQNLVLVSDGDPVFVLTGHANQGGSLWREIRTLRGIVGWVQEEFLILED